MGILAATSCLCALQLQQPRHPMSSLRFWWDIFFMQRRALHAVHVFQLAEALCLKMNVNDDTSSKGMRAVSSG